MGLRQRCPGDREIGIRRHGFGVILDRAADVRLPVAAKVGGPAPQVIIVGLGIVGRLLRQLLLFRFGEGHSKSRSDLLCYVRLNLEDAR
jgi:hypothetical protein